MILRFLYIYVPHTFCAAHALNVEEGIVSPAVIMSFFLPRVSVGLLTVCSFYSSIRCHSFMVTQGICHCFLRPKFAYRASERDYLESCDVRSNSFAYDISDSRFNEKFCTATDS